MAEGERNAHLSKPKSSRAHKGSVVSKCEFSNKTNSHKVVLPAG